MKKFMMSARIIVSMTVYAEQNEDGEVNIVSVENVFLPDAREVMESLDADDFSELDKSYEEAEELP